MPVDHRVGLPGVSLRSAQDSIHAQNGLFSINHEDMYYGGGVNGNRCVGCAWDYADGMERVDAMEVAVQRWDGVGFWFSPAAIDRCANSNEK